MSDTVTVTNSNTGTVGVIDISQAISSVLNTFVNMFQMWMQIYIQLYMFQMLFSIMKEMFSMFKPPAP